MLAVIQRSKAFLMERTWHRVSVFGTTVNFVNDYVQKGSQLYIEGQLQTRKWQDQSGQDRYTTEVVVRWPNGLVQLLGSANQVSVIESNGVAQKTITSSLPVEVPNRLFRILNKVGTVFLKMIFRFSHLRYVLMLFGSIDVVYR